MGSVSNGEHEPKQQNSYQSSKLSFTGERAASRNATNRGNAGAKVLDIPPYPGALWRANAAVFLPALHDVGYEIHHGMCFVCRQLTH